MYLNNNKIFETKIVVCNVVYANYLTLIYGQVSRMEEFIYYLNYSVMKKK